MGGAQANGPALLQRRQVGVYAVAVALAVATAVASPGSTDAIEAAIEPVLAALLYVTFLETCCT